MTPKQRKIAERAIRSCVDDEYRNALSACLAQADKVTPEAEADRRLGARLREWGNGWDPSAGTPAECLDRAALTCGGTTDAYFALRAWAAALREEAGR